MNKQELINYLDVYLAIDSIQDDSKNGLQVDNEKAEVKKIGYAVDATNYIFDLGIKEQVDIMLVHHGIFRGKEQVLTNVHYKRIKKLLNNNIALYACHLPLDAHPEVGNNIVLAKKFIEYFDIKKHTITQHGHSFGVLFDKQIETKKVQENFCKNINIQQNLYDFGDKKHINSILFSSGGGLYQTDFAKENNYDLLVTGEGPHRQIMLSKDLGQNILLGGHYETEVFGVQALSEHLKQKLNIEIVFLDEKY